MPRPRNHEKHITQAVGGVLRSVEILVHTVAAAFGGSWKVQHRGGTIRPEQSAAMRRFWARMTPAERAARSARLRAGHAKSRGRGK
jgi:hypothetical protein